MDYATIITSQGELLVRRGDFIQARTVEPFPEIAQGYIERIEIRYNVVVIFIRIGTRSDSVEVDSTSVVLIDQGWSLYQIGLL